MPGFDTTLASLVYSAGANQHPLGSERHEPWGDALTVAAGRNAPYRRRISVVVAVVTKKITKQNRSTPSGSKRSGFTMTYSRAKATAAFTLTKSMFERVSNA